MASFLEEPSWLTILEGVFITLSVLLISTRFLTASQSNKINPSAENGSLPPKLPYWVPVLGHWWSINVDPGDFLEGSK
jgi:hypothetical protein